jgi:hypothetical protein
VSQPCHAFTPLTLQTDTVSKLNFFNP